VVKSSGLVEREKWRRPPKCPGRLVGEGEDHPPGRLRSLQPPYHFHCVPRDVPKARRLHDGPTRLPRMRPLQCSAGPCPRTPEPETRPDLVAEWLVAGQAMWKPATSISPRPTVGYQLQPVAAAPFTISDSGRIAPRRAPSRVPERLQVETRNPKRRNPKLARYDPRLVESRPTMRARLGQSSSEERKALGFRRVLFELAISWGCRA